MKLKNIVVATEKKGYYNVLEQSCKRHNIDLIPLGMGEEWTGFTKKFKLWRDYLNTLNDNEIVMLNDAYDVVILEDGDTIIKKFKTFNKNIVFGHQNDIISKLVFPTCNTTNYVLCTGNIIGYVKYLKQLMKLIFKNQNYWGVNTDQIIVNTVCNIESIFFKNNVTVDKKQYIFFVTPGADWLYNTIFKTIPNIYMKNNKLYNINNETPSILHLAGDLNGKIYMEYLKYKNIPNNNSFIIQPYKIKQLYFYLFSILQNNIIVIFLSIISIIIYLYFFKTNIQNFILFIVGYIFMFDIKALLLPFILLLIIGICTVFIIYKLQ
tara:strand:+ start:6 stop:971 length:966 start_codon:yes stop_codon:yes gene_type:complete